MEENQRNREIEENRPGKGWMTIPETKDYLDKVLGEDKVPSAQTIRRMAKKDKHPGWVEQRGKRGRRNTFYLSPLYVRFLLGVLSIGLILYFLIEFLL